MVRLVTSAGAGATWYGARNYANDYTVKLDWKAGADNADSGGGSSGSPTR